MELDPSTRRGCFLRRASLAALMLWLSATAFPAVALAQEAAASAGKSHMHTVLSYGLVIFVIALGLLILCRPANRKRVEGGPAVGGLFSLGKSESGGPAPGQPTRKKPHRGVLLLVLSIAGWVVCPLLNFAVYSMANTDLEEMHTGRMDRSGEGLAKAAKIISLIVMALVALSFVLVIVGLIGMLILSAN